MQMVPALHSGINADFFAKGKRITSAMMAKWESGAESDATQKSFSDKELSKTNKKKVDKTAEIDKLETAGADSTANGLSKLFFPQLIERI